MNVRGSNSRKRESSIYLQSNGSTTLPPLIQKGNCDGPGTMNSLTPLLAIGRIPATGRASFQKIFRIALRQRGGEASPRRSRPQAFPVRHRQSLSIMLETTTKVEANWLGCFISTLRSRALSTDFSGKLYERTLGSISRTRTSISTLGSKKPELSSILHSFQEDW
ncbi:hypothetical protein CPB85DRAFT_66766 [Mucidula mucida]|nr:hypothetical protein CPB85DRAFT_66766 [Mucidula mucida]